MKYENMIRKLEAMTPQELSVSLGVPFNTLMRFLKRNGYSEDITKKVENRNPRRRVNTLDVLGSDSAWNGEILTGPQKEILLGSIMGDASVVWSTLDQTAYVKIEHCWSQIGYLKAKYELLRPLSFSPYLDHPQKGMQDYQVGFSCHSSEEFAFYRRIFYTREVEGKSNLQKDVMQPHLWELLSPLALAVWIMDDGKKYGTSFTISIGRQSYYSLERLMECVRVLNDKTHLDFRASEDATSFSVYVNKGSPVVDLIKDYVWPDMAYKVRLRPEDCGAFYRGLPWFSEWETARRGLVHPLLENAPYSKSFFQSLSRAKKEKYLRALFSQVRVRGFPDLVLSEEEREKLFETMKNAVTRLDGDTVIVPKGASRLPNSFMGHRYRLNVRGCKSPYEVFLDNKLLKETLKRQLDDGPRIEDSNIRAALCVYKTQAVGQFNPLYARFFCETYCPERGTVLDPCAGFGSRLIGCVASGRSYYGIEPSSQTYEALLDIKSWLHGRSSCDITVVKGIAEESCCYGDRMFDMALTSPPYFSKEEYSREDTQSFVRYPEFDEWLEGFLRPLIRNVFFSLRDNSRFILNIGNDLKRDIMKESENIALSEGFILEDILFSGPSKRPGSSVVREAFFVYRKSS